VFTRCGATLAGPVSYEVGGEQYVSVPAGYGGVFLLINGLFLPREGAPTNARVYTFKLGGSAPEPVIQFARIPTPKRPVLAVTGDRYRRGALLYDTYCLPCRSSRCEAMEPA
jgi:quinohemoprotein ethanol dehydrogenase